MAGFTVLEPNVSVVFSSGSSAPSKTYSFVAVPNGTTYFGFQVLGGYDPGGSKVINLRFRVNSTTLGTFQFHRWTDHYVLILEHGMVTVPQSALISLIVPPSIPLPAVNTLTIDATSGVSGDYFFIGPMVWHTN